MITPTATLKTGKSPARKILRARLRALHDRLELMQDGPSTPKDLHELRILVRRAEAALLLTRDVCESKAWGWLRRKLRRLRRGSNRLRDDDVLRKWLAASESSAG